MTEIYVKEEVAWRTMVKVPLWNSFLERRDDRRKFSESLRTGASLAPCTHSSADSTWIRKWLKIQAPELSELESFEHELGSCCSDLHKQVSGEICRTRKRQFEIPFSSLGRVMPPSDFMLDSSHRLSRKRRRTDRKDFYHAPQHHKP